MKVLLTGGSGFLAAHCLESLLQHGHDVVFTVRSPEKGDKILKANSYPPSERLSYTIVEDITNHDAFSAAVQSIPPFDAVIHTASPFHYKIQDAKKDVIDPAVLGTTSLLTAVHSHAPSVKRVVITSSFSANYNIHKHPDVYNETHWNPVTLEEATKDPVQAYRASKTFAERSAWDFVDREKPNFTITTMNPPLILGPLIKGIHSMESVNTSNAQLLELVQGKWRNTLPRTFAPYWVDVRDVALAHTKALECPDAAQKRFLLTAGSMCNADIARIVRDHVPKRGEQESKFSHTCPTMTPTTQIAAYVENPGPEATLVIHQDCPVAEPGVGEVLVKLEVAGLCHSDINRVYGPLPLINKIVGHEGVGRIVQLGPGVNGDLFLKRVGVGWLARACMSCAACRVDYTSCPNQNNLGRDLPGTLQQYVAISADFVHLVPDALPAEIIAPLLCAGITMYSAIRKANLKKNDWLLLPGAGGGLGHLGIQIAKQDGYRVIAVVERVQQITDGAGAQAVICTSGAIAAYKQAADCVQNVGTIVCIGVNPNNLPISPLDMVRRGLRLVGSAVGSHDQMQDLMKLACAGKVKPIIEVLDFDQVNSAAQRLEKGAISGRLILRLPEK
ncbi:methylglyoxal reductase (NADPH-dependent) gre2 [Aspergillus nanangensis]|uniref:Methylglyoxal reductase (NADPH-dependent) gre2 n=1 Tax=Aspergillus nanangensis TaxID=2582783 RepID=A0AAD4GXX9_ASPNN|nr:methylglyoxal reductase (NADPH-dependent) gre2 [Aspergillus nanangensis]